MTETGDRHEANAKHFQSLIKNLILNNGIEFTKNSSYGQSVIWASERIAELESQTQSPERSGDLTLSNSTLLASPESDEEIHQRRRRERLLDEITLFCVTFGFDTDDGTVKEWGNTSRGMAIEIINGINEHDAKH